MDGSLLLTTGPVVATVPDCIRVTMVLLDIFGLASSQTTWFSMRTCARTQREMQLRPPLSESIHFQSDWEPGGPPPLVHLLSWHLSELSLAHCSSSYRVCLRDLWSTLTIFVSSLSPLHLDNELLAVLNPNRAQGWSFVLFDFKLQIEALIINQIHFLVRN